MSKLRDHSSAEKLLRRAGRLTRSQVEAEDLRRLDPRWDSYAAGNLSVAESRELLAKEKTRDGGEELAELFRPLGADFQARLTRRALNELDTPSRGAAGAQDGILGRLRALLLGPGGRPWGLIAAATAITLMLLGPRLMPGPSDLPTYTLEVQALGSTTRDQAAPLGEGKPLRVGKPLRLGLRPATATREALELRIYIRSGGGLVRWPEAEPESPEPNEKGFLKFDTPAWAHGPGRATLIVALGPKGTLPQEGELIDRLTKGDQPGPEATWQWLKEDLDVVHPSTDPRGWSPREPANLGPGFSVAESPCPLPAWLALSCL